MMAKRVGEYLEFDTDMHKAGAIQAFNNNFSSIWKPPTSLI